LRAIILGAGARGLNSGNKAQAIVAGCGVDDCASPAAEAGDCSIYHFAFPRVFSSSRGSRCASRPPFDKVADDGALASISARFRATAREYWASHLSFYAKLVRQLAATFVSRGSRAMKTSFCFSDPLARCPIKARTIVAVGKGRSYSGVR
jgi:hypothetical protein